MIKNVYYLNIAKAIMQKSPCLRRQYGALIVKNDEIISTGYNGPPRGLPHCQVCLREQLGIAQGQRYELCQSVHAEANAIISAARSEMLGSTLYLVGQQGNTEICALPCDMCLRLIQNAGIKQIICGLPENGYKSIDICN